MGGDEITAKWLGDVYGFYVTTSNTPVRFLASSNRFRDVYISNKNESLFDYIGKYSANDATFSSTATIIYPKTTLHFKFIDLYELGYKYITAPHTLEITGVNKY